MTEQKRQHIRFKPDPLAHALIDPGTTDVESFTPKIVALIVDEAPMGGCGLVMLSNDILKVGDRCLCQVGDLNPLKAMVVWLHEIDSNVCKLGIKFLE